MIKLNLKNKKGFTIVELVIVIAVIAILAAILIPTFSNVVNKANAAAIQAELKSAKTQYIAEASDDYNYDPDLNLVFKHTNNKGKIIYYLEESGSFIPAEGFNFKDNAPIEGVYFVPLQYKSGTDEWLFAEFSEGTVGIISYLGSAVESYASLVEMRDLAYGGGKYDNDPLPTWKAIDSGYEVTGTLNYHDLTVSGNNPLGFLNTEHWFLKFSIMPPKDFAPTADTKIQVQSAVLAPSLVVSEFLDGSSDWIVGISPNENVTVTIDWDGTGKTFFKEKTYFIDLSKVILAPNPTP